MATNETTTRKRKRKQPTPRELAAVALSFFFNQCSDDEIELLLRKTIRDWIDWLYGTNNKTRRFPLATLPSRRGRRG